MSDKPKTKKKVRVTINRNERIKVIFSGSEAAFKIWQRGHWMPLGAEVEHRQTPV